jgi:hypothetical protein
LDDEGSGTDEEEEERIRRQEEDEEEAGHADILDSRDVREYSHNGPQMYFDVACADPHSGSRYSHLVRESIIARVPGHAYVCLPCTMTPKNPSQPKITNVHTPSLSLPH